MDVHSVTQVVSLVVYGALMCVAVRFWRRQGDDAAGWLVATFGILASIVLLGVLLPEAFLDDLEPGRWHWQRLALDVILIAFLGFPYLLHRFTRSLAERVSVLDRTTDLAGGALAVWTVALPSFPGDGARQPNWYVAYVGCFLLWWFVLLLGVSVSMWRAGRGLPGVARRRMRSMATAALLMNAALIGSTGLQSDSGEPTTASILLSSGLGWLSAAGFWMGFSPPALLRRLWRGEDEVKLRRAEEGLTAATSLRQAAEMIVAPAAALLGSRSAIIFDVDGAMLARSDRRITDSIRAGNVEVVVGQHCRLVVERSRHVPLFGSEEEALLRALFAHFDLVLDRVAAFEASEAARRVAQRATRGLQELVYGISHDLKNPLLTIAGFVRLLDTEADGLTEDGRSYLNRINASTGYMKRLIDDLLQLSRVGHTDAAATNVDLRKLVEEIGLDIRSRYEGVSVECDTGVVLRINLVRARQLFSNLIENAARHGGHDHVTVRVAVRHWDDRFAEIHVADDGVGVPSSEREKVFGLFERLKGFSASAEGTGIGLTMCRRIVEDLSGSVDIVDSDVGTDIRLCLPTAAHTPANPDQKAVVNHA